MAPYIPFANTKTGCDILTAFYSDATAVRVTLDQVVSLKPHLPTTLPLWIDPAFEGFSIKPDARGADWQNFIRKYPNHGSFEDPAFRDKPSKPHVQALAEALMNGCIALSPCRITIPQWPVDLDHPKFKLNRLLAEAATQWRSTTNKQVDLILPVVFTHQSQLADKAARNKTLSHVQKCLAHGQFEGLWCVDASLADQDGTGNFENDRFKSVLKFFDEVREVVGPTKHITAGPHWGLNLVLWARGQINHPAIGLGSAYQYHVHGGIGRPPKTRVALSPLRRWATYSAELKAWLLDNVPLTPAGTPAHESLSDLQSKFANYAAPVTARRQIAQFYREWFHSLDATPPTGRALALYQDLSSAYVLGKTLGPLPKDEKSARRPERVAKQLMLNCL